MAKTSLLMVQIVTAQSAVIAVFYLNGFTLRMMYKSEHIKKHDDEKSGSVHYSDFFDRRIFGLLIFVMSYEFQST